MKGTIKAVGCAALLAGLLIPTIGLSKTAPLETNRINATPIQTSSNLLKLNPQLALYIDIRGGNRGWNRGGRGWNRGGYGRGGRGCIRTRVNKRCWRNSRGQRRCTSSVRKINVCRGGWNGPYRGDYW